MRKNKPMRLAAVLLVLMMLTICFVGGTFAKYVSSANGTATTTVAKWGWGTTTTLEITNLFAHGDTDTVASKIAPGTDGNASFTFAAPSENPEVAYSLTVDTDGSSIDSTIENNSSIQWKLGDTGTWGTWETLLTNIKALSKEKVEANTEAKDIAGTVYWQWIFENETDTTDTTMGNAGTATVTLMITVTATQLNVD